MEHNDGSPFVLDSWSSHPTKCLVSSRPAADAVIGARFANNLFDKKPQGRYSQPAAIVRCRKGSLIQVSQQWIHLVVRYGYAISGRIPHISSIRRQKSDNDTAWSATCQRFH